MIKSITTTSLPIAIADDVKYLGPYNGSTKNDIEARIGLHLVSICKSQTNPDIAQKNSEVQDLPL